VACPVPTPFCALFVPEHPPLQTKSVQRTTNAAAPRTQSLHPVMRYSYLFWKKEAVGIIPDAPTKE
jgi:hypothetical protein